MTALTSSCTGLLQDRSPGEESSTGFSFPAFYLYDPTVFQDPGSSKNFVEAAVHHEKTVCGIPQFPRMILYGFHVSASPSIISALSLTSCGDRVISTYEVITEEQITKIQPLPVTEADLRVDRLTKIQAAFGLSMKDFAEVLRISRAQLYKWIDSSEQIDIHDSNHSRLLLIEDLAKYWRKHSQAPLSRVIREPLNENLTLFDLLKARTIDKKKAEIALAILAEKLSKLAPTREQRLARSGFKRYPSHRSLISNDE